MKLAKLKMFAPYDTKLQVWMSPMFFLHAGQAERTWMDICNSSDTLPSKHPSDFILFQVGEFDDETGRVDAVFPPVQLMTAVAAKAKDSEQEPSLALSR